MKTLSTLLILAATLVIFSFDTAPKDNSKKKNPKTAFGAYLNHNVTLSNATETLLSGWAEEYDNGNAFDPATGEYTVPEDGVYAISTKVHLFKDATDLTNAPAFSRIRVNGGSLPGFGQKFDRVTLGNSYGEDITLTTQVKLAKNDIVTCSVTIITGGPTALITGNSGSGDSFFSAVLVE